LRQKAGARALVTSEYTTLRALFDDNTLFDGRSPSTPLISESEQEFFSKGSEFDQGIKSVLDLNDGGKKYYVRIWLSQDLRTIKRMELITLKNPVDEGDDNDGLLFSLTNDYGSVKWPHEKEMLWLAD
jgi:hypothetical protein